MAALTVTATEQPGATPPRVRLDITASGTPTVTSVAVTRTNMGGRAFPVRTADGGRLPVSGAIATIYDYEIPYGTAVTYSVEAAGASAVTASALLSVTVPWLVHVGVPARSTTVDFRAETNDEEMWGVEQGVFPILGSDTPVVISGGVRYAPESTLLLRTDTPARKAALRQLLSDGSPLLLNVPPLMGAGLETCYISVGPVRQRRRSNLGTDPHRVTELPYRVVSRPAGGSQALITWQSIYDDYGQPTWQELYDAAGQPTWAELANPIT